MEDIVNVVFLWPRRRSNRASDLRESFLVGGRKRDHEEILFVYPCEGPELTSKVETAERG